MRLAMADMSALKFDPEPHNANEIGRAVAAIVSGAKYRNRRFPKSW